MLSLSWAQFNSAVDVLTRRLVGREIASIYGVPRGGLPMAVALSHSLKVPLITGPMLSVELGPKTLIVDDIADHGVTLGRLRNRFGLLPAAVWVRRDRCARVDNLDAVMMVGDLEWILFPWEKAEHADADKREYEARR